MININYYEGKGRYKISATGHAYYDEPGKDIVCCSVCVLLLSLGMFLESNEYSFKLLSNRQLKGDIDIEVVLEDMDNQIVPNLFYMVISGLEAIENTYPEYVKITEKIEKEKFLPSEGGT